MKLNIHIPCQKYRTKALNSAYFAFYAIGLVILLFIVIGLAGNLDFLVD